MDKNACKYIPPPEVLSEVSEDSLLMEMYGLRKTIVFDAIRFSNTIFGPIIHEGHPEIDWENRDSSDDASVVLDVRCFADINALAGRRLKTLEEEMGRRVDASQKKAEDASEIVFTYPYCFMEKEIDDD